MSRTAVSKDEEEFVAALRRGEPAATGALYERLYPIAVRAVQHIAPKLRDQEDTVQAALERVHRTLISGRFSQDCSLTTWTIVIARNVAIDQIRARVREHNLFTSLDEIKPPKTRDMERTLLARSELQHVQLQLDKLNQDLGNAVVLGDVLQMSVNEIATSLGLSKAAAHSRLRRGRLAIRRRAKHA